MKQSKTKYPRYESGLARLLASGLRTRLNNVHPFTVQDDQEAAEQQRRPRGSSEEAQRGKGRAANPG